MFAPPALPLCRCTSPTLPLLLLLLQLYDVADLEACLRRMEVADFRQRMSVDGAWEGRGAGVCLWTVYVLG